MSPNRPVKTLNAYYKNNEGFRAWVDMNEKWFRQNPEVFRQLLRNPNMVNLFMDLLVMNAPHIEKKLNRRKGKN